jgi:DNA-binding Xre family transcriptional regulator
LRGKAKVCGWSDGRIPWPLIRVGHGGKGAFAVTPELARAIRTESVAAMSHWWGVSISQVPLWRRALRVDRFNQGTRNLWSHWKEPKLPNRAIAISKKALRQRRLANKLTLKAVAMGAGWTSHNTYAQLESGQRLKATRQTLKRLAQVFGCQVTDLVDKRK